MTITPAFFPSILVALILLLQPSCKPKSNPPSTATESSSAEPAATSLVSNPVSPQASPEQTPSHSAQEPGWTRANYAQRAKQRFEQIKTALALTDDQTQKAQAIMDQRHSDMQALRANQTLTREQRMAQAKELRDNADTQIRSLLTPDQQTKWDGLVQQREQEMAAHRAQWQQGGGFGGQGAPQ